MNSDFFYEAGKMPDRYYFQLNKDPQRAYKTQREKKKNKRQEMTFAEKLFIDLAQAELYAILRMSLDNLIDGFNSKNW